jgi:hypothetical protein
MPIAAHPYKKRQRTSGLGASGLLMLAAASLLSACGADKPETARTQSVSSGSNRVSATAEEVAEAARGRVKCPAKVSLAERDPTAPVDDIVGVRPGMSYEEAANVVMCTHDLMVVQPETSRRFRIETYGHTVRQGFSARLAEPKVQKTSREIMQEMQDRSIARSTNRVVRDMQPGQAKWYVGTMGLPGKERVINAAREEWFEEGRNPTMASIERALIEKYGPPTQIQRDTRKTRLTWAYDPFGRAVGETSPLFNRCRGMADPDGGSSFSPDCGLVVAATVSALSTNPDLAEVMQVGIVDQGGGYEALVSTERGLQNLDVQRKARETEAASKNAATPTL